MSAQLELARVEPQFELRLGVRTDLENDAYHASPGISNSGLNDFARSPAHFYALHRDSARPPRVEKAGQLEGTLAHCATLEPAAFYDRYVVVPSNAPTRPTSRQWGAKNPSEESKAAMRYWTTFEADNPGKRIITAEQYDVAHAQAAEIRKLPEVADLLRVGQAEVSAYWTDEVTGELCRCRPDFVHPVNDDGVILLDVKTYSDASPSEFARQVGRKGYHRQDAFYSEGYAKASGKRVYAFIFVAVETAWPFKACACMLDDDGKARGAADVRALLDSYATCNQAGIWPGYSTGIELISLPRWMS